MKKYYIADLLTVLEVILSGVVIYLGFHSTISSGIASFVILIAELCDAFDGIAARTWPYPVGNYPWRKFATLYDILSDLLLGATALWYIIIVVLPQSPQWSIWLFWSLFVIEIPTAISIEIITAIMTRRGESARADRIYVPAVVLAVVWPLLTSG